jgi:enoyl-CoA hydratase
MAAQPRREDESMSYVRLHDPEPGIRVLTLDKPARLNAIDFDGVSELHTALDSIAADPECRAVILTGAGRGFCAGLDLKALGGIADPTRDRTTAGMRFQEHIAGLVPKMRSLPQPIVAAVNGPATGGGLAFALAADVRIAAVSASFAVSFIRVGLSGCDIGVSYLLPRLVGASRAFELMLTGRVFDSAEADRIGLVTRLVDDGSLMESALDTARLIRANSPFGVWMTKEVMWANLETPSLAAAIDRENRTQMLAQHSGDMAEAVAAFLEKRPADFSRRG